MKGVKKLPDGTVEVDLMAYDAGLGSHWLKGQTGLQQFEAGRAKRFERYRADARRKRAEERATRKRAK